MATVNTSYLGSTLSSSETAKGGVQTSYLSTGLTEITSALSIAGVTEHMKAALFDSGTTFTGAAVFSSTLTVSGLLTASSGITVPAGGQVSISSNVSIGGSGTLTLVGSGSGAPLKTIDSILTSMAAIGVANAAMKEVQVAFAGSAVTDVIDIGYPSAISTGLTAMSYVSSAGTIVLRVVNASASTATQAASVWRFTRFAF